MVHVGEVRPASTDPFGRHQGFGEAEMGWMAGRKVKVRYCSVMRVSDGKVVEGRDYYDSAGILQQLGLIGK